MNVALNPHQWLWAADAIDQHGDRELARRIRYAMADVERGAQIAVLWLSVAEICRHWDALMQREEAPIA